MVGCHLLGCRLAVAQRGSTSRTQSGSRLTQSRCFESTIHTGSNISVTIWRPKRQRRAPLCSTQRDHLEICRSTCARLSRDMHLGDTVSSWGCTSSPWRLGTMRGHPNHPNSWRRNILEQRNMQTKTLLIRWLDPMSKKDNSVDFGF